MAAPALTDTAAPPASAGDGLTGAEAARRLSVWGPNATSPGKRLGAAAQFARQFASPLVAILLLAAVVSGILGDVTSAVIIGGIVVISAALDFWQTYHSEQAADSLRRQVAPTATVRRGGVWQEIPRPSLVPGDLIRLQAGDMVPADALVAASETLYIQQAAMTGESIAVEKTAAAPDDLAAAAEAAAAPPARAAFRAADPNDPRRVFLGTSVASGSATALVTATGRRTAFGKIAASLAARPPETEFERGMRELSLLVTRAVTFLVLFVFLVSAALRHNALQSLLFAVALAVGLTPEFLPMIDTVTLGRGAVRMAKKKVIVKHLQSIENLGGMDVLCSDKTGTLTQEEMRLERAAGPEGAGDSPLALAYARLNARFETGIKNEIDAALLAAPELPGEPDWGGARRLGEIPFDFERRRLSVVARLPDGRSVLVTKGAPESVLPVCMQAQAADGPVALQGGAGDACAEAFQRFSAQGYRVLAVAVKEVPAGQTVFRPADEAGMTLVGYVALSNPPLPDAAGVLARLKRDGVAVKILTGDNELVTGQLCGRVGLDSGRIVMGSDLDAMSDIALGAVAENASVFARVSPEQKNRIILALKRRGHVVGYIGDGINDAPSLHSADVGISVASGTDVARDAADIILLERSLSALNDGIVEGRRAFANVQKYILMNLSSNFGNMLSMAGASLVLPFLPMLPNQVLLNNFLYDLSQVTIPTDRVDDEQVAHPRRWDLRYTQGFMVWIGPISSLYDFLTFWALRAVFHAPEALFHTGWFVESLATQTLVIFVIRTSGLPWRSRASVPLIATILGAVTIALLLPYTPFAGPLGFVPLPPAFFAFLAAATVTYLALVEIAKRRLHARLFGGRP